jgi:DNA-binding response OmpR family regulator
MFQVLIVEDNVELLEMVALVLKSNGMEVDQLQNGDLLFQRLNEAVPDLILMDIYLGYADGRQLCRALKKDNKWKTIPVILYSAGNISHSSIRESGADAFISKPFDVWQLVHLIQQKASRSAIG